MPTVAVRGLLASLAWMCCERQPFTKDPSAVGKESNRPWNDVIHEQTEFAQ